MIGTGDASRHKTRLIQYNAMAIHFLMLLDISCVCVHSYHGQHAQNTDVFLKLQETEIFINAYYILCLNHIRS